MAESYSVEAILSARDNMSATIKGAAGSLDGLEKSSSGALNSIKNIATGLGVFKLLNAATNALTNSVGDAVDRYDTLNRYPRVLEAMGYSTDQASSSTTKLAEGIKGLPTALDDVVATAQNLTVLTGNLEMSTDATLALNDAFLASGSSTADASRGLTQFTQMLSKGKVDGQSWNTLLETMGYALDVVAQNLGYTSTVVGGDLYNALKNGEISFNDFTKAIIAADQEVGGFADLAKTVTAGIGTAWTNMQIAVVRGVTRIVDSIDTGFSQTRFGSIQNIIESFGKGAESALNAIAPVVGFVAEHIDILGAAVVGVAGAFAVTKGIAAWQAAVKEVNIAAEAASASGQSLAEVTDAATLAALKAEATQKAEALAIAENNANKLQQIATEKKLAAQLANSNVESSKSTTLKELEAIASDRINVAKKSEAKYTAALSAQKKAEAKASELAFIASGKEATARQKSAAALAADTAAGAKNKTEKLGLIAAEDRAAASSAKYQVQKIKSAETINLESIATKANAEAKEVQVALDGEYAAVAKLSTEATLAQTTAQNAQNITLGQAIVGWITNTGGITGYTVAAVAATAVTNLLKIAMKAIPFMLVMAGITALVSKLPDLIKRLTGASGAAAKLAESFKEERKAADESVGVAEEQADKFNSLVKSIISLSTAKGKDAGETARLNALIDELNGEIEGLGLAYDETTGQLNMTTDVLLEQAAAFGAVDKVEAYRAKLAMLTTQEQQYKDQLVKTKAAYEGSKAAADASSFATEGLYDETIKLKGEYEDLQSQLAGTQAEIDSTTAAMMNSEATADKWAATSSNSAKTFAEAIGVVVTTYDTLSESQQAVVDSLTSSWETYKDAATNMFDTISTKSELTIHEMTANLEENQRVVGAWADNIAHLASLGIDDGLLQTLIDAGPESAGYVQAIVDGSEGEIMLLSDTFAKGGDTAMETLKKTLGADSDILDSVGKLVTETGDTLAEQIEAADFGSIGKNIPEGVSSGIEGGTDGVVTSVGGLTDAVTNAAKSGWGIHSPSKVFEDMGYNLDAGLANGILKGQTLVNTAFSKVASGLEKVSISGLNKVTSSFSKEYSSITTIIRNWGTTVNTIMTSAMTAMLSAANAKLATLTSAFRTQYNAINTIVKSAMNIFTSTMSSGMSSAISIAQSGASRIVAALNMYDRMYSQGLNAMAGFRSGLSAGASSVYATANTIANNVARTVSNALIIRSPSRVMMALGEYTMEGFAVGLENMQSHISAIMAETSDMVSSSISSIMNAGNMSGSFAATVKANTTSTDAKLDELIDLMRQGNVIMLDGDALVGGTLRRTDQAMGSSASYASRWGRRTT